MSTTVHITYLFLANLYHLLWLQIYFGLIIVRLISKDKTYYLKVYVPLAYLFLYNFHICFVGANLSFPYGCYRLALSDVIDLLFVPQ